MRGQIIGSRFRSVSGRYLFSALVVGLALLACRSAIVASLVTEDPQAALRIAPGNALALVNAADQQLLQSGGDLDFQTLAVSARQALTREPLSAGALRQLGLAADATKDHGHARGLMQLGSGVSRRDFGIDAWLIEDRVAANDVPGALNFYDLALSVSDDTPKALYPVLSAALSEPEVRTAFGPYLKKARPWMPSFLFYAITTSTNPEALARMILEHGGMPAGAGYRTLDSQLLNRLVAQGQYDAARHYALSLPGVSPGSLDEVGFSVRTTRLVLASLAWQFTNDAEIEVRQEGETDLLLLASPNARGVAATRILILKPGTYRLSQVASTLPQTAYAPLSWEMHCLPAASETAAPIWQQELPADQGAARYSAVITIPARCRAEQLSLIVAGRDLQVQSGVRLGQVALRPMTVR